jgi:hypothetical protein
VRGSFGWRGDGRDFSWKGSATLEGTAQQNGCRVCGKRPVVIQLYQYIYTLVFIMVKQKIDIFDLFHQNDALDSQR